MLTPWPCQDVLKENVQSTTMVDIDLPSGFSFPPRTVTGVFFFKLKEWFRLTGGCTLMISKKWGLPSQSPGGSKNPSHLATLLISYGQNKPADGKSGFGHGDSFVNTSIRWSVISRLEALQNWGRRKKQSRIGKDIGFQHESGFQAITLMNYGLSNGK